MGGISSVLQTAQAGNDMAYRVFKEFQSVKSDNHNLIQFSVSNHSRVRFAFNALHAFNEKKITEYENEKSKWETEVDVFNECGRPSTAHLQCQIGEQQVNIDMIPTINAKLDDVRLMVLAIQQLTQKINNKLSDVLRNQHKMIAAIEKLGQSLKCVQKCRSKSSFRFLKKICQR